MTERQILSYDESEVLANEIATISSQIDAAIHRLLTCIRRFDEGQGWGDTGALSCAHWLTWRIGLGVGAAREYVGVAKALGRLPLVDEALRCGQVSYSKVRALTRRATPENEATLLEWARSSSGAQLEKVLAKYRYVLRIGGHIPVDDQDFRFVRQSRTPTGMVRVTAQLLPEEAEILKKALEIARERASAQRDGAAAEEAAEISAEISEDEFVPAGLGTQRWQPPPDNLPDGIRAGRAENASRVDGLLWLAEAVLAGQVGEPPAGHPVEIVVHTDAPQGGAGDGALEDGHRVEPETTARLFCDASVVELVEDEAGTPLDVGRRTRTISTPMRRALQARDGGCRFPGCTHKRTDGHHIVPWSEGGATSLENLVSLCRRHHRFVHEGGWTIEVREGNEILFYDSLSNLVSQVPLREVLADDAVAGLRASFADEGINIDEHTAYPLGDGTVDYNMAVQTLFYAVGPGREQIENLRGSASTGN